MENGHVITIMQGSKEEMQAQLDWLIYGPPPEFGEAFDDTFPPPPAGYLLTDDQIDHLLKHGYIPGKDIVLLTEFLINDDSILLRDPLIVEFMGYADEWDIPTNRKRNETG